MLGALAGDIIGSVREFLQQKTMDFPLFVEGSRFTDDTVLTVAVAECLLTGASYVDKFHQYARDYPDRCYGLRFWRWVESGSGEPYNSWGNGSAMRVSPVGFALPTLEEGSPTTSIGPSMTFARRTPSPSPAKALCPKRSSPSSTPPTTRRRSGWRYPSAVTPIPSLASLVALRRRSMAVFRRTSPSSPWQGWMTGCGR